MTFEKILDDLTFNVISAQDAYNAIVGKDKMKKINYYIHFNDIAKEPLNDSQLQELTSIVGILQILYNSDVDSPVSDSDYDNLQETLISMGIPRLTGTVEINDLTKVTHKYTRLRGTLDKVYYLTSTEKRVNKSRKYLDEWIKSTESLYRKNTGKDINLNDIKVILTPKFDGASSILEVDDKMRWITRGDTNANLASDVTHIMHVFDDLYSDVNKGTGIKFEVMVSEESKGRINDLCRINPYRNSRQIVTATLNSNEPDYKVDYLYPVPLRIIHEDDDIEEIHPDLIAKFPTEVCKLGDREVIREFANRNRYVNLNGQRLRTDGVVITILDKAIARILGRDNNINNFEVAYKFTEECAYSHVRDVEFNVSEFGYICPVLVVNDVILKGNKVDHISLSNKERFDELNLSYGDEVKVLYDIIPYVTLDEKCKRVKHGRKIEFIKKCPRCKSDLDLNVVQVRCNNPECPSRLIGRIHNYCDNLRIKNIGYSTIETLYDSGFLKDGIRSLYRLKKHANDIMNIDGFGRTKTKKIINEIEAKRRLNDFEFFGSIGIDGMSVKTFQLIFSNMKLSEFMNMISLKNFDLMRAKLISIGNIGPSKADTLLDVLKDPKQTKSIMKILKEVTLYETYGGPVYTNGRVTFTGCRPDDEMMQSLRANGYEPSSSWSDKHTKYLVVPSASYESAKVTTARSKNIPIITKDRLLDELSL